MGESVVDRLLPHPAVLLETTLIYFLVSKVLPWVKDDLTCVGYGAIFWGLIALLYIVGLLCNARLSGSWVLALIGSIITPALCIAVNPLPLACTGLFGEVEEAQKDMDFFLEGQAVITAIAAILFGIVSIRAVAVGRGYEEYHQQDDL